MEKILKVLLDFQKFQKNERLQGLLDEVKTSEKSLSLEDLNLVNAAGDNFVEREITKENEKNK